MGLPLYLFATQAFVGHFCLVTITTTMLKNISWSQFIITCFFLTSAYYLVVISVFYRGRIAKVLRRASASSSTSGRQAADSVHLPAVGENPAVIQLDAFAATKEASEKLKSVISRTVSDGVDRQDVLESIRVHLDPYKQYNGSAFGVAIRNSITRELSQVGYTVTDKEMDAMWSSQ